MASLSLWGAWWHLGARKPVMVLSSSHFLLLGLRFVYVCACAPALVDPHPRCLLPQLGKCPCSKTRVAISEFEIISRVRAKATSMGFAFRAWDNHGRAWWPLRVGGGHFSNTRQSVKLYVTKQIITQYFQIHEEFWEDSHQKCFHQRQWLDW